MKTEEEQNIAAVTVYLEIMMTKNESIQLVQSVSLYLILYCNGPVIRDLHALVTRMGESINRFVELEKY